LTAAIVIPITSIKGKKNFDQLLDLLSSIAAGEYPCEILCCFDACEDEFVQYFVKKFPFIVPLSYKGNRLHFARNCNRGMRFAHQVLGKGVILVNQDCVLPHWKYFKEIIQGDVTSAKSVANKESLEECNQTYNDRAGDVDCQKFPFYCTYISKEVMDKIGYLDGVFMKGGFEDDDLCTRALLAGFQPRTATVFIYHEGTHIDTSKPDWESACGSYNAQTLGGLNLPQYTTKWQIPPEVPHEEFISWVLKTHEWEDRMAVK
jgi:GT2 family glycosyltransferase